MLKRWQWILKIVTRRLWFRATLFSVLGVGTALLAIVLKRYIPGDLPGRIGADAVDNILEILASSMLATTTFSLNIMVSAYASATSNATPRATTLLVEDATTQNVLATFVGSFLFSLVGIIALSTGLYGRSGRVVLFAVTIVVILIIVYTLLRWIDHLAHLGRLEETIDRVEQAATTAMKDRQERPFLGASRLKRPEDIPTDAVSVCAASIGYVQHIDIPALAKLCGNSSGAIFVCVRPGSFVGEQTMLARVSHLDDASIAGVQAAFSIGVRRSFEQDPRFGLAVLAEIASRALSPGVNDPGTAIDVIGRAIRVLAVLPDAARNAFQGEPGTEGVFVPALDTVDLFAEFFGPLARDAAPIIEVGIRLQKALAMLSRLEGDDYRAAAVRHAELALHHAEGALTLERDKATLRALAIKVARDA